jgi:hypothetical protein
MPDLFDGVFRDAENRKLVMLRDGVVCAELSRNVLTSRNAKRFGMDQPFESYPQLPPCGASPRAPP